MPLVWNFFQLTGTDKVAWQLMQVMFPGSWKIKSRGALAESNYLVPSPYGDSFDVLNESPSVFDSLYVIAHYEPRPLADHAVVARAPCHSPRCR
jgi:hypothetical protein